MHVKQVQNQQDIDIYIVTDLFQKHNWYAPFFLIWHFPFYDDFV